MDDYDSDEQIEYYKDIYTQDVVFSEYEDYQSGAGIAIDDSKSIVSLDFNNHGLDCPQVENEYEILNKLFNKKPHHTSDNQNEE